MQYAIVVQARLAREGKLGPVARLMPTKSAKTLRKGSDMLLIDGPFAETKEQRLEQLERRLRDPPADAVSPVVQRNVAAKVRASLKVAKTAIARVVTSLVAPGGSSGKPMQTSGER